MDFVTRHLEYIQQCANCRAIEIAETAGRFADVEDYRQEILVWIVRRQHLFNARRGKPTTFIAMTAETAKKRILRRLRRGKNRIINDAIPLP